MKQLMKRLKEMYDHGYEMDNEELMEYSEELQKMVEKIMETK